MNTQKLENVVDIVSAYFGGSVDDYIILDIAMKLYPYADNLEKLVKKANKQTIKETIAHDYNGLRKNDIFFLPRLA